MEWIEYKNLIIELLNNLEISPDILNTLKDSIKNNQRIYIAGNGGSGATAAHYMCDLSKGAVKDWESNNKENRYKVHSLTTEMPYLLAIANDADYNQVFKQQLINLAEPKDILIAISGSGNSKNIIEAVDYANEIGMVTIGISGYDGGKLKEKSKYNLHVNSFDMEACEDVHSIIGHFIAKWLKSH
ncbi:D-sedoheptulose 7-phosphate isomerase [Methanococcus voltae PS]|uniref:Phosphoheptose isomerase n=2 Tax=Methanococcus voltae TaxID=2188 RepID=Q2EMU1_METVO|nr:SIS domain-containing protein [Methanococcus voltae]ABD17743.1 phosphoheptose isomerase [Methanococcus voltae PS]MCS3922219.1 D-sedoheptulose 7-phosphate isomerase [Methanococcus voltae PS]